MKVVVASLVFALVGSLTAETNAPAAKTVTQGRVTLPAETADFEARTFVLKYAKATEVADSLNRLCKQLGVKEAAVAFPESHTVAVAATPKTLDACAKIVAEVDRKPKQVYVEARFLDLMAADLQNLGIHWGVLKELTVGGSAGATYTGNLDNQGSYSDGTTFTGTLSAKNLQLILAALRINNDNRMFANPRVVVASGKTATVDITTKRPNVTITAKRTVDGNNNSMDINAKLQAIPGKDKLMFADESFFWWGISLTVEPYVAEDGIITARIVPNVSSLSDTTVQDEGAYVQATTASSDMPASQFPIIDVKRIETEFSLKSGETAVIGGLSKTEFQEMESGIPYLWRIPIIGPYLFGYTEKVRRQREIVVLVTVGLVDPETPDKAAGLPKNAVIAREYVKGDSKEPGDHTKEELREMYHKDLKPNSDN